MSELSENAASHNGPQTRLASGEGNRVAEFAARADLMLARYPAEEREQIAELLRLLATKPGDVEKGVL